MLDERFIQICGQPLRYLIGGQGKPLVLCHGFLSSAEEFGGRFSELGALRTLIIPDLPGNGASPALPGRHTSGAMADLLFDLLTELEIDKFDVGGLCLGATVACALAKRAGIGPSVWCCTPRCCPPTSCGGGTGIRCGC